MSLTYLRLVDNDGNGYTFPLTFKITDTSWRTTQEIKKIAYAHGGKNTSDGYLEARVITIEGVIIGNDLADLESLTRSFNKAVLSGGKLYVSDDTVNRYLTVSCPSSPQKYTGDSRIERPVSVSFVAEYPFWEDETETESVNVLTGNDTITIDNSGSDSLVNPIIEISADQSVDMPSVKLINKSDGGMYFEYNDPNFIAGDVVEIDCRNGTVKRNSNPAFQFFNPARFLRLQNVINTITYEGAACTVTFKYRKVYL